MADLRQNLVCVLKVIDQRDQQNHIMLINHVETIQKAPKVGHTPGLGCILRFCLCKSNTGPEEEGSLGGVQHPERKHSTQYRESEHSCNYVNEATGPRPWFSPGKQWVAHSSGAELLLTKC